MLSNPEPLAFFNSVSPNSALSIPETQISNLPLANPRSINSFLIRAESFLPVFFRHCVRSFPVLTTAFFNCFNSVSTTTTSSSSFNSCSSFILDISQRESISSIESPYFLLRSLITSNLSSICSNRSGS